MATITKAQKAEQLEAIEQLRELLSPGSTVRTILRHVSRSGMSRSISTVINGEDYTWLVARATGDKFDQVHGGIKVGGCGMDMGFALVYGLSRTLYRDGFACIGQTEEGYRRCPANDHSNDYLDRRNGRVGYSVDKDGREVDEWAPTRWHSDGGYAVGQRWL